MAALKTLVLSSSPTSPQEPLAAAKTPFKRGHTRNKSTSSAMAGSHQDFSVIQPIVKDCKEVTPAEWTGPLLLLPPLASACHRPGDSLHFKFPSREQSGMCRVKESGCLGSPLVTAFC